MKLRQMKKVWKAIGTPREANYKHLTFERMFRRYDRLKTSRHTHRYFYALMDRIGPEGRAYIIRKHNPAGAFDLLMREVEASKLGGEKL